MMKKHICFLMLFLCSFTTDNGLRTIDNKLYSISIPLNWKPMQGMPGDGTIPGERETSNGFHLFYWAWSTPIKSREDIPKTIGIDIQSYQRLDGKMMSVEEIEQVEMSLAFLPQSTKKTTLWPTKGQKRFFIIKEGKEMDGETVAYRTYYLFQQSGNIVHCIKISLRDELAQQPGKNEEIKMILDSFKAKKNIL